MRKRKLKEVFIPLWIIDYVYKNRINNAPFICQAVTKEGAIKQLVKDKSINCEKPYAKHIMKCKILEVL